MKRQKNIIVFSAILLSLLFYSVALGATNEWAVDSKGNITLNGSIFRVKGGSWFGLEGRSEPSNDKTNPGGAPMELYIGNMFWNPTSRTLAKDAAEIKNLGFNCIRMPVSPQTLNDNDPQGRGVVLKNTESVRIQGAFSALKAVVKACSEAGLYVLLDMHSCSNYVGWRAGRLDARPPYTDANRPQYDFKREDCSCATTGNPSSVTRIQAYDEAKWLADLRTLAGLGKEIGVDNIMGIDIFNEPWDYSWNEWKTLIEKAYAAINPVNPNILIFAQGVGGSNGNQDGTPNTTTPTPYGKINPNWGENLYEAGSNPPAIPKSKLVYSPHCYGPAVCTQPMFADLTAQPECAGLVEDAFGDAECQIVINPKNLEPGWHEHFGYLRALGYAICIGEFGGNMDWPNKSEARHQQRYSYLKDKTTDEQWQKAFVDYCIREGITNSFYWSINPESADTYGIFKSPYDPQSNPGGWGTWDVVDTRKTSLLSKIWTAPDIDNPGQAAVNYEHNIISRGISCRVSGAGLITYTLPKAGFTSVKLFCVNGRLQSEINIQYQKAGTYSLNQKQLGAAKGSYVLVLNSGEYSHKQMIYLTK